MNHKQRSCKTEEELSTEHMLKSVCVNNTMSDVQYNELNKKMNSAIKKLGPGVGNQDLCKIIEDR